jgi:hypothetical protein
VLLVLQSVGDQEVEVLSGEDLDVGDEGFLGGALGQGMRDGGGRTRRRRHLGYLQGNR